MNNAIMRVELHRTGSTGTARYRTFTFVPSANWFWPLVITWELGSRSLVISTQLRIGDSGFDFQGMGFSVLDDKDFGRAHGA